MPPKRYPIAIPLRGAVPRAQVDHCDCEAFSENDLDAEASLSPQQRWELGGGMAMPTLDTRQQLERRIEAAKNRKYGGSRDESR